MPRHYQVFAYSLSKVGIVCNTSYNRFSKLKREGLSTKQVYEAERYSDDFKEATIEIWKQNIEEDSFLNYDKFFSDAEFAMDYFSKNNEVDLITARRNKTAVFNLIHNSFCDRCLSEIIVVDPYDATSKKIAYIAANKDDGDIVIGDTEVDYDTGQATGLKTFLLNRGFRSEEYWQRKKVRSFQDLKEIINAIQYGA